MRLSRYSHVSTSRARDAQCRARWRNLCASFHAAEGTDLILNGLLVGYWVYETPRVCVTHAGFRNWEQRSALIHSYMVGLTAMYVKHAKCGHYRALYPFFQLVWRWAFSHPAMNLGPLPSRALRFSGFRQGLAAGLATPVDSVECKYMETRLRTPRAFAASANPHEIIRDHSRA